MSDPLCMPDLMPVHRPLAGLRDEFPDAVYIDVADEARRGYVTLIRKEQGHRRIAPSEFPHLRAALARRFRRDEKADVERGSSK